MSSVPLVALSVQPQANIGEQMDRAVRLKSLLGQQQLLPGQLQAQQLENQQRQQQVSQTQSVNQAYRDALTVGSDGTPSIDQEKLSKSLAQNNAGAAIPGILKSTADYQKSMADVTEAHQKILDSTNDAMGSIGSAIQKSNYDPNMADLLLQHQMSLPGLPPAYAQQLKQLDQQIKTNPGMVKQIADGLTATSQKQQTFQNQLQVAGIRAGTPEAKELQDAISTGQIKDASQYPAWKAQQVAQANLGVQNSPQAIAGAATKAAAEASAKAPIEVQNEVNKQIALQKLSPAALANVRPNLIAPATSAFDKAGQEYATAYNAAQNMQDFLNEAKSGNKTAIKIVPLQGALEITTAQGVHRINRTEVDQFGGGGSAYDKLAGLVGKTLTGKDIDDSVLNSMDAVQKTVSQNAANLHANKVATINQAYGSQFEPMKFGQNAPQSAQPGQHPFFSQFGGQARP